MKIPRNERKRIINEFVTQIMQKLRVPDEYWRIEYTPTLTHPTSRLFFRGVDSSEWQYRNLSEAIKYAYLKDYLKTEIIQVPETPTLLKSLKNSLTGVVSSWNNTETEGLLNYLIQRKGINFWMREDKEDNDGDMRYLIYKYIYYEGNYYIAVLNTEGNSAMWCNLYSVRTLQDKNRVLEWENPTIPIVITPFSRSKLASFINWDTEPWEGVK